MFVRAVKPGHEVLFSFMVLSDYAHSKTGTVTNLVHFPSALYNTSLKYIFPVCINQKGLVNNGPNPTYFTTWRSLSEQIFSGETAAL